MAAPFTHKQLAEVKDSAPQFGFEEFMESRFARDGGLEFLVFGTHTEGDAALDPDWWTD